MGLVGAAANGVLEEDDPVTQVDGTKCRGENAGIGFSSRQDECIHSLPCQKAMKVACGPRRIGHLVHDPCGRHLRLQGREEVNHLRPEPVERHPLHFSY